MVPFLNGLNDIFKLNTLELKFLFITQLAKISQRLHLDSMKLPNSKELLGFTVCLHGYYFR